MAGRIRKKAGCCATRIFSEKRRSKPKKLWCAAVGGTIYSVSTLPSPYASSSFGGWWLENRWAVRVQA